MWQIIGLQLLVILGAVVSLFLKKSPDFDPSVSISLVVVTVVSAILSIIVFAGQDKDVRFLKRNVENLVRSVTLNSYVRDFIASEISKQAGALGLGSMQAVFLSDDLAAFAFHLKEREPRVALLLIGKGDFNRFAVVNERDLPAAINHYLTQPMGQDPSSDWNALVKEVGQAAQYVASESEHADPSLAQRMWANGEEKSIGLATRPELTAPDITFDSAAIAEIQTLPRIERHQRLAHVIEQAIAR